MSSHIDFKDFLSTYRAFQVFIHSLSYSYLLSSCHGLSAGDAVVNKMEPLLSLLRKSILHCVPIVSPSFIRSLVSPHLCNDSGRLLPCSCFTNEELGQRDLLVVSVEDQYLTSCLPDTRALPSRFLNLPIPTSCE